MEQTKHNTGQGGREVEKKIFKPFLEVKTHRLRSTKRQIPRVRVEEKRTTRHLLQDTVQHTHSAQGGICNGRESPISDMGTMTSKGWRLNPADPKGTPCSSSMRGPGDRATLPPGQCNHRHVHTEVNPIDFNGKTAKGAVD